MAHSSWLEDIFVPPKMALDSSSVLAYMSKRLMDRVGSYEGSLSLEPGPLLFVSSLPKARFTQFLNYLVLSYLKNDKSLLINGGMLKKLSSYLTANEMKFLIQDRDIKINLHDKMTLPKDFELNDEKLCEISFQILKAFFPQKDKSILALLKYRFPKSVVEDTQSDFFYQIDLNKNQNFIAQISKKIFPGIYQVCEMESNLN